MGVQQILKTPSVRSITQLLNNSPAVGRFVLEDSAISSHPDASSKFDVLASVLDLPDNFIEIYQSAALINTKHFISDLPIITVDRFDRREEYISGHRARGPRAPDCVFQLPPFP